MNLARSLDHPLRFVTILGVGARGGDGAKGRGD